MKDDHAWKAIMNAVSLPLNRVQIGSMIRGELKIEQLKIRDRAKALIIRIR